MTAVRFPGLDVPLVQAPIDGAGFAPAVLDRYRTLRADAHRALDDAGVAREGRRVWIAPGRIEVLGKHVDYAGGRSLLCTVERGIVMVAAPRTDRQIVLRDSRRRELVHIPLDPPKYPGTQPPPQWSVYPRTVVRRLQKNFGDRVVGLDIAMASNLPPAAGASSSSALTVGLTLAIAAMSGITETAEWRAALSTRTNLAGYIGALENGTTFGDLAGDRGVGTMGGAQDQTAVLCCAPGKLDVFCWAPVQHERAVAFPADHTFLIGVSGVVAAKSSAAKDRYNRVARTAHHLVAAWNARPDASGAAARTLAEAFRQAAGDREPTNGVPSRLHDIARAAGTDEFPAAHLEARLAQFHAETWHHVPEAAEALSRGDLAAFGRIVAASQQGAEDALENQIAETRALVSMAIELGAVASSAFGAGFGGSVWAMIPTAITEAFSQRWRERYLKQFPQMSHRMQVVPTRPSAPVFEVIES